MNFSEIILEGRVENFQTKFSTKFTAEQMKRIVQMVLPKYLDWVGKNMDGINFDENFPKIVEAIKKFNKISTNLPITDLYGYKSINQLFEELQKYETRARRNVRKVPGGNVVYEDDRFFVVNPLTHESSCYYGKGTKWCTASSSDYNFKKYNDDSKLFYVIDKKLPTDDVNYKVAILKNFDGGMQFWDAQDRQFTTGWILNTDIYNQISDVIENYMNQEFSEQIEIYTDKEKKKKEAERLRGLEIARILRQREEDAEDRRTEGEWNLGPNCPDVGLKAHALLEWLVDTSDVSAMTNEDRIEIQRLKDEIERLQNEYDADEETRTDLLDEISDLEEELSDLENKIDVYNIIPTGSFYSMQEFEVINAGLDDRRYAVGDSDEIEESCRDYVDGLIDDIGFRGFSVSFVQDYIDSDAVRDYAEDYFRDDVYENPEMFLDESDRQLSRYQNEQILIKNNKIEKLRKNIEEFESIIDQIEDEEQIEDFQEKINEFEENIEEFESEIEEIQENPEGDYPEHLIDEKVEELVEDRVNDPMDFIREMGLEWENFINRNEFIQGVVDADGYGHTLNGYDGNADEVYVENTLYYVMRID